MSSSRLPARTATRRGLLRRGAAGAAGFAALGLGVSPFSGSSPRTAAQTGPWAGGEVRPAARSSRQMAAAARAFLGGLGAEQLARVQYPDLGDAARTRWKPVPDRAAV